MLQVYLEQSEGHSCTITILFDIVVVACPEQSEGFCNSTELFEVTAFKTGLKEYINGNTFLFTAQFKFHVV
jgi:hypothetical protein